MPGIENDKSSKMRKIIIMVLASILALNAVQKCCFRQSERRNADAGRMENSEEEQESRKKGKEELKGVIGMIKEKRHIGWILIVLLLLGGIIVTAVLTKNTDVPEKTFHAILVDEKENLSVSAGDSNNLYIICTYKDGKPSALSAIKFMPAEGYSFNGQVQCWLREDGQVEYLVNGDLYTRLSGDTKETIVEDTSDKKIINIETTSEKDCSKNYLYEHSFI